MGHWVGHNRGSLHMHRTYWLVKYLIFVECNVRLTTDTPIIYRPPVHTSTTPPAATTHLTAMPDDKTPEQASAPDRGAGEPPGPVTPNDNIEQVGADKEPLPSLLTSPPYM